MMTTRFSEGLVLDDSEKGVIVKGITDETIAAKSGLRAGDEIVAATIHLDHLSKSEVMNILRVLEPYDNNMKVLTKKDLSANVGLGSLGLRSPAEMLNIKKDLSLDASAEAPVLSLDGRNGNLNTAHGLKGDINGPTLNGDLPSLNFKTPSAALTGPDLNGDLDGTFKTPDVGLSAPQLKAPSASVNVNKPGIKTNNYKAPKFTMPTFNLPHIKTPQANMDVSGGINGNLDTPDVNLSSPKLDLGSSDLHLNGPKGPDVNLEIPNANLEPPSSKLKWPNLKWKGPKGPEADLNADLSAPDVNLSTPKLEGGIDAPNVDIDAPSGKINWPKFKMPGIHGKKTNVDLDGDLNKPDVDLTLPTVEGGMKGPDIDFEGQDLNIKTPNIDAEAPSGKINWPHLKWKKPKMPGLKADLDHDLDTPNFNLSSPNIKGDIDVPNAELNLPKADVEAPNVDFDGPSGKINWPHLKWKKPKLHGPKADLNADLSTPDLDVSLSKLEGGINTPDVDLNLPKANVDVKAPDANIGAPSGKIRFPTWKKSKDFSLSHEMNGPDGDLNLPKANLDVKAPNADIEAPSGKIKWPTFKKSKINSPDVDKPDWSLSSPKADAEINVPDVKLNPPKADVDIDAPDAEGLSGKFKWFKKISHGTLKVPKADVDGEIKLPDVDINKPQGLFLSGPDLSDGNVTFPKLPKQNGPNIDVPEIDAEINARNSDLNLKAPKADVDIDAPDAEGLSGKFNWFKNISHGTLKSPKADVDGEIKLPDVDINKPQGLFLSGPDLSDGNVTFPKLPKQNGPNIDIPEIDAEINARNSDLNLKAPKADVDIDAPDAEGLSGKFNWFKNISHGTLKSPKADVDGEIKLPDVDINKPQGLFLSGPDLSDGNVTFPKLPKQNGPNIDIPEIDAEINAPNCSLPKMDAGLNSDLNLKAPKVDLKGSDPSRKFKMPSFNFGGLKAKADPTITAPGVSVPDADLKLHQGTNLDLPKGDFQVPNLSFSPSEIDGNFSAPSVDADVDASLEKSKWPHFKIPGFGSKTKGPDVDTSTELDISPDLKVNTPDFNEIDEAVPQFRLHRLPRHSRSGSEDFNLFNLPKHDTEEMEYVISKGVRLPKLNAKAAATDKVNILERLKMAREKATSANASPTDPRGDIDLNLGVPSFDTSASAGDLSLVRGGTFKVEKPESALGLIAPEITDENDKMSLSLSNMLGLNVKDSNAD